MAALLSFDGIYRRVEIQRIEVKEIRCRQACVLECVEMQSIKHPVK
ncbi:unnamed protein product [marine sediment metagenome]|uniref:Uncharacterized protein n=1 Tax=marine sediment metagenome TaxID=412755 RepID=X0VKY7_9ZZZZ